MIPTNSSSFRLLIQCFALCFLTPPPLYHLSSFTNSNLVIHISFCGSNPRSTRNSMLCPLYMAEISPPEFRGALMAMEQFSIVLGCVLGFWAGFFTRQGTYVISIYPEMSSPDRTFTTSPSPYSIPNRTPFDMMTLHGDLSFTFGFPFLSPIPRRVPIVPSPRDFALCPFAFSFSCEKSKDQPRGGSRSGFN